MERNVAFVSPLPLVSPRPTTRAAVCAVLDTPASNPYLKKVCAGIARDFLTRRAVHTVLYYYTELQDAASKRWLLEFDNFAALEKQDMFHDSDEYLIRMLGAPTVKGVMERRHPYRSYLNRKFTFTIQPSRVASSILASRLQLAGEWAEDLRCVDADNVELQRRAFERILETDEKVLASRQNLVFDTGAFNSSDTPLRAKNFKKLLLLLTQHAITRLMAYLRDTSNHDYMWLMNFVARYGALDDGDRFILQLMQQPAESRTNPCKLIDPRALAVEIMDLRSAIASEWMSLMRSVPEEQLVLQRRALERTVDIDMTSRFEGNM